MSTLDKLTAEVARMLNVESVNPDLPLGQLGIDSLNVVELVIICQQIYTDVVNYEEFAFEEHSTLREIDEHMLKCSAPA